MEHDFGGVVLAVAIVTLAPVVADGVREDGTSRVESSSGDTTTNSWVPLQSMLSIFVPEVESPVTTSSAERPMLWVERNIIDRVHLRDAALRRIAMAFERKV